MRGQPVKSVAEAILKQQPTGIKHPDISAEVSYLSLDSPNLILFLIGIQRIFAIIFQNKSILFGVKFLMIGGMDQMPYGWKEEYIIKNELTNSLNMSIFRQLTK